MKIGMVSKFGEEDGIAIYSGNLVDSLRREGVDVIRIGDKRSNADYHINLKSFRLGGEVSRIADREKLDLVHFQYIAERSWYGLHTLNLNLVAALRQRVPVVATLHEVHYTPGNLHELVVKKLEAAVIRSSRAVIVHTARQKEYIEASYKRVAEQINMGVTLHPMHRRKGCNLLFFGIISPAKGVEFLIGAAGLVKGAKLRIAGRPLSEKYGMRLRQLAAGEASIDLGWVGEEKKKSYFSDADIIVLPYLSAQYQSAVMHDALSYGSPVVVTRVGAIWEIVDQYGCGEIVEPGSSRAIAGAVERVYSNYGRYQKGILRYRKEASWAEVAKRHIRLYERCIGRK